MAEVNIADADINAVRLLKQATPPAAPPSSSVRLYPGTDDKLYMRLDTGEVIEIGAGAGGAARSGMHVGRSGLQTVAQNVWTKLDFNIEHYNSGGWNPTADEYTVPDDGLYLAHLQALSPQNAGTLYLRLYVNAAIVRQSWHYELVGAAAGFSVQWMIKLTATDVVQGWGIVNNTTGIYGVAAYPMEFALWRLDQ